MKNKVILFSILFIAGACGLFNRTTSTREESKNTVNEQSGLKTNIEQKSFQELQVTTLQHDSVMEAYNFRLWPKDSFSFSPEHGFTGKFDSIHVTGSVRKLIAFASVAKAAKEQGMRKEKDYQQKKVTISATKHEKKKSFPAVKLLLTGLIIIAIAGYWVFKERFK